MTHRPTLYSFCFAADPQSIKPELTGKNIFQFKINRILLDFLWDDIDALFNAYSVAFSDDYEKDFLRGISLLASSQTFVVWLNAGSNDHWLIANITIPEKRKEDGPTDYLLTEVKRMASFFKFLEIGSQYFASSEEGKEYLRPLLGEQKVVPGLIAIGYRFHVQFEIKDELRRKLELFLLYREKCLEAQTEITRAINSVQGLPNTRPSSSIDVVLRRGYVSIHTQGGCMFMKFGEVCLLSCTHIDTPLQMMTLLAVAGTLFRLAENN